MTTIDTWNLLINRTGTITSGVWNGTPIGVSYGGTGATSVAGAQQGLAVQKVAWRSVSSGTDTLTIADGTVEYSTSCTVTLPAGSTGIAGDTIRLVASAANVTLTIQRAGSDTIDGGTSITVALGTSRAACLVVRQTTTTAWGSVQPNALTDANLRFRMYVSGSVVYVVLEAYLRASWALVKGPAEVTKTAGTAGLGTTASGTGFNFPAGYAVIAATMTASDRWVEPCDGTGVLGVTWTPGSYTGVRCTLAVNSSLASGANYVSQMAFIGDADFTPGIRWGLGRASGGSGTLFSQGNDAAISASGVACAWSGPALAYLGWQAAGAFCGQGSVRGTTAGGMATGSLSTSPSGTLTTPTFGLVCSRTTLGGSAQASSGVELCVYVSPGELSW